MNTTVLKKIRYNWKMLTTVFTCFFGISLFFICSAIPQQFIGNYLHVDPSYTGGLICADFVDFPEGSGALVRYTVHKPVTNARWQQSAEYWQLSLEFYSDSSAFRNIMIYIDADNIDGGSTETLFASAEKLSFDEEHPWDFALWICDGQGNLYDSTGDFICSTEYYSLHNDTKLNIRIPLHDKRVQKILGSKKTWHYVIADSNEVLTSTPLEAKMTVYKKSKSEKAKDVAYINYVKQLYAESVSSQNQQAKNTDETLAYFKEKLNANPDDYVSLACYGSFLAVKGGESSVMKAVALVNEAYTYLDKAAELAAGKEGKIEVLMNRASVSASVPEQVFGKAESGAEDFIKIISLTENQTLKAYCYVMAYECYQKCGKETQAILALQEAQKMVQYQ